VPGGSSPPARAFSRAAGHQARSSSTMPAAAFVIGLTGSPARQRRRQPALIDNDVRRIGADEAERIVERVRAV